MPLGSSQLIKSLITSGLAQQKHFFLPAVHIFVCCKYLNQLSMAVPINRLLFSQKIIKMVELFILKTQFQTKEKYLHVLLVVDLLFKKLRNYFCFS